MITEKMKVEQYIPLHNAEYVEYCEALLFEDGEIKEYDLLNRRLTTL